MDIKLNIGDPDSGETVTLEADGKLLRGKRIGETFKGEAIDKTGWVFRITGGSDTSGFPMRADVDGTGRRRILVTGGVGYRPQRKGQRARRTVAGNTIGADTAQVNAVVEKRGSTPLIEEESAEPEADAEESAE